MPSLDEFREFFAKQSGAKRVLQVNKEGEPHYSLTLTVSGDDKRMVAAAIELVEVWLNEKGLKLNADKTRIASYAGQQRVTGVIVNSAASPPRTFRRNARAAFHQAAKAPAERGWQIAELGGILGFLKMFPKLKESREVHRYQDALRALKAAK